MLLVAGMNIGYQVALKMQARRTASADVWRNCCNFMKRLMKTCALAWPLSSDAGDSLPATTRVVSAPVSIRFLKETPRRTVIFEESSARAVGTSKAQ